MISSKKPDDAVGEARQTDDFAQTAAQQAVLGSEGDETGRTEPKDGWGGPGAGRGPATHGGNSQGHGDRMPSDGEHKPATNPKTQPGERHEA